MFVFIHSFHIRKCLFLISFLFILFYFLFSWLFLLRPLSENTSSPQGTGVAWFEDGWHGFSLELFAGFSDCVFQRHLLHHKHRPDDLLLPTNRWMSCISLEAIYLHIKDIVSCGLSSDLHCFVGETDHEFSLTNK